MAMPRRLAWAIIGAAMTQALAAASALAADDIEQKAQVCAACHGANGVPADPKATPIIWGQQASYIVKQLHDYRTGDRANPIMSVIAQGLAREDLRKLAVYFAAKPWPTQATPAATAAAPQGLAQCLPCHQSKLEGGPPAPRLAGLSAEYMAAQMRAFATGERNNNGDMPKLMNFLTDAERDAIARYAAALP